MARVAIIEPRSSGHWLVNRANELGHEVVVLTHGSGSREIPAEHLAAAIQIEIVDTNDDFAVLAAVRRIHYRNPLHAVLPGFEHYLPIAARAAQAIGVPGVASDVVGRLRFKHQMRAALGSAQVDQPLSVLITDDGQLTGALRTVGLPCVVKPVDQSGSLNVRKVSSLAEARSAFDLIQSQSSVYLERQGLRCALVEEYIDGAEFSVEGYVENGSTQILGITEKVLGCEPYFVEVGHILPAPLEPTVAVAVCDYVRTVIAVLGLGLGPFHAEVRLSDRGPLLMEVAARLPGDRIPYLLALALSVDLYEVMLRSYLGVPNRVVGTPTGDGRAGIRFFVRPDIRSYARVTVGDRIGTDPRIKEISILVPPDSPVPHPGSSSGRLGYVVATGSTYQETVSLLEAADAAVSFS
jgi:biotin carboxylase